jgi:4-amino-4-deoxy-L-arabinose transferase-like glycosyltransferase
MISPPAPPTAIPTQPREKPRPPLVRLASNPITWIAVWLAAHLIYNGLRELVPDEAYYWVWSRHLALGYLDHPPMIAWLIALSTAIFGTSEWSVRLPCALLGATTLLVALWMLRRQPLTTPARRTALAMLLLGPLMAALGTLATPDTPSFCFSTFALACALQAIQHETSHRARANWWLAFGLFCGLALLSKYTSILLPISVLLALATSSSGRRHLLNPGIWLGLIFALVVFSPVLWWNAQHHWASFRFQLHHGFTTEGTGIAEAPLLTPAKRLASLATYLAGQAAVWTPVFFILGLLALRGQFRILRHPTPAPPATNTDTDTDTESDHAAQSLLLFSAVIPLLFFAVAAVDGSVELNWPAFAYVPLTLITARFIDTDPRGRAGWYFGWTRFGCILALCCTLVAMFPELIWWIGPDRLQAKEMFGWRQYAATVQQLRDGDALAANDYQPAAELSFYLPGRPEIFSMNIRSRPSAYDFFPGRPDLASINRLLFIGKLDDLADQFPHVQRVDRQIYVYNARVRGVHAIRAWR